MLLQQSNHLPYFHDSLYSLFTCLEDFLEDILESIIAALLLYLAEQSWVSTGPNTWQRADLNGWVLTRAEKVNNSNWIVAYGVKNSVNYAVVLSPRP